MIVEQKKYFKFHWKAYLLAMAVFCFSFFFPRPSVSAIILKEEPVKLSSLTVPVNGVSLLAEGPVVPAASGVNKRNGQPGPGFYDRGFISTGINIPGSDPVLLHSYRKQFLNHSLRLHLALCVLLI